MPRSSRACAILAALAGTLAIACGPKHASSEPTQPADVLVVLLPDPETNVTGRAVVSNKAATADLRTSHDATTVRTNQPAAPVTTMTDADVQRVFGAALAALPPAPRHFTLNFKFESDELTDESRALLPQVLAAVKSLSVPEVVVVGHTDTMGTARANIDLGMKRGLMVRGLLIEAGLDASTIEVRSHGEGDLLVRTPDETPEPRNRRVEISVR
ncbi:MAG: OmpA family protein [Acidobacteria bacterium]|nr:MAG: OmpA family protein [Acidobacteriota bacterium]